MKKNSMKTGVLYVLTVCTILSTVNTANAATQYVEVKKRFDGIESLEELAERVEAPNGEYLYAENIEIMEEYWESGFELPAVCHNYGSDAYYVNNDEVFIEENDLNEIVGAGDDFLMEAGLDPEKYTIREAEWRGDAYENEDGVLCRSLLLRGDKYVADYVVTYSGNITMSEPEEETEVLEEETIKETEEMMETQEKIQETEPQTVETVEKTGWFDRLKKLFAVLTEYKKEIVIGFSAIALLIVWLFILRCNKKHQS